MDATGIILKDTGRAVDDTVVSVAVAGNTVDMDDKIVDTGDIVDDTNDIVGVAGVVLSISCLNQRFVKIQ